MTIKYDTGGTATAPDDYDALPGTATLPAGETSVDVPVTVAAGQEIASKTVMLTLKAGSGYQVGPIASSTITLGGAGAGGYRVYLPVVLR